MKLKFNFDWICFDTKYAFDQIEEYFGIMSAQIETLKENNMENIRASLENAKDIEDYQLQSSTLFQEHYYQYEENLPRCLTYSFITMIYTLLERRLNELCNDLIKKNKIKLSVNKLKGSLSERIELFFKAFNLNGIKKQDINTILEFSRVRNQIVHENGQMENASNKLKNYIKNIKDIKTVNNQLIIEPSYCIDHLIYFKKMFSNAFTELGYKQDYTIKTEETNCNNSLAGDG
jgi:hypothetical protein